MIYVRHIHIRIGSVLTITIYIDKFLQAKVTLISLVGIIYIELVINP